MSTIPSCIPSCIPTNSFHPNRRKHSARCYTPLSSLMTGASPGSDEGRFPRSMPSSISITHLREAIRSLDCKMATLISQRHELESHLEQAVRLQSPVLRLPSELLSSIFVMGVLGIGDENPVMVSTLMLVWYVFSSQVDMITHAVLRTVAIGLKWRLTPQSCGRRSL